jgi:hypothetical protein
MSQANEVVFSFFRPVAFARQQLPQPGLSKPETPVVKSQDMRDALQASKPCNPGILW